MRYTAILSPLAFFLNLECWTFWIVLAWRREIRLNLDKFFTSLLFQARVLLIRICQKQTKLRGQLFQSTRDSTFSTSLVSHHFSNKFKLIYNWCGDHYWEILHQKKWSGLKMWLLWYWLAVDRGWWWVDGRRRRRVMERGVVRHTGVGPHRPKTTQKLDHIDKKYTKDRPHWP